MEKNTLSNDGVLRAGTVLTCSNGHPICDVVADIHPGDEYAPKLGAWRIPEPVIGERAPRCPSCGATWIEFHPNGEEVRFAINGKWTHPDDITAPE